MEIVHQVHMAVPGNQQETSLQFLVNFNVILYIRCLYFLKFMEALWGGCAACISYISVPSKPFHSLSLRAFQAKLIWRFHMYTLRGGNESPNQSSLDRHRSQVRLVPNNLPGRKNNPKFYIYDCCHCIFGAWTKKKSQGASSDFAIKTFPVLLQLLSSLNMLSKKMSHLIKAHSAGTNHDWHRFPTDPPQKLNRVVV